MAREEIRRMLEESGRAVAQEHEDLAGTVKADLQKLKRKALDRV